MLASACASLWSCLCIDCASFSFATLDNDKEEVAVEGFIREGLDYFLLLETRDKPLTKASHSKILLLYYLLLSIMHILLLKFLQNKNIFLRGTIIITTINITTITI